MPTNASICSAEHFCHPVRRHQVDEARPETCRWSLSTPTNGPMIGGVVTSEPKSSTDTFTPSDWLVQTHSKWTREEGGLMATEISLMSSQRQSVSTLLVVGSHLNFGFP
jgi:hypothetical protein